MPDLDQDMQFQDEAVAIRNIPGPFEAIVEADYADEAAEDAPVEIEFPGWQLPRAERTSRLKNLEARAKATEKRRQQTFLSLLSAVQEVKHLVFDRREQVAVMAKDWGMSTAEARRLLSLRALRPEEFHLFKNHVASPDSIIAYLRADEREQRNVLALIESGRIMHASDISKLKKRRTRATFEGRRKETRGFINRVAAKAAHMELETLNAGIDRLVKIAAKLYPAIFKMEESGARRWSFLMKAGQSAAQSLLAKFDEQFALIGLPPIGDWWEYSTAREDSTENLAWARAALETLATGNFSLRRDGVASHACMHELVLIQSLAWLAGRDVSHLQYNYAHHDGENEKALETHSAYAAIRDHLNDVDLTSLEICSGAGGEALGLHAAGFTPVGIYEFDPDAVKTLKVNGFGPVSHADIRDVHFGSYAGKVDLFAGGVPCQPHSTAGFRLGREDERDLFLTAIDIVRTVRPRAIMLENVAGFGQSTAIPFRAELFSYLSELGYDAELFAMNGEDYGLAQLRPRVVLVAFRDNLMSNFAMPPILTPDPLPVGDALVDLMAVNGWRHAEDWAKMANTRGPTLVGGSKASGGVGFSSNFQLDKWRELGVDASQLADEAPDTDFGPPIEGNLPRLTLEMGARLQGFPDNWVFEGSRSARRRQVGNAFPPIMAQAMGIAIRAVLKGEKPDYKTLTLDGFRWLHEADRPCGSLAVEYALMHDMPAGDDHRIAEAEAFKKFAAGVDRAIENGRVA